MDSLTDRLFVATVKRRCGRAAVYFMVLLTSKRHDGVERTTNDTVDVVCCLRLLLIDFAGFQFGLWDVVNEIEKRS